MKKVLFTAIAVVGFSTVTLANNPVEVKEVKTETVVTVEETGDPCAMDQWAAIDECKANGCDERDTLFRGASAWGDCMSGTSIWN